MSFFLTNDVISYKNRLGIIVTCYNSASSTTFDEDADVDDDSDQIHGMEVRSVSEGNRASDSYIVSSEVSIHERRHTSSIARNNNDSSSYDSDLDSEVSIESSLRQQLKDTFGDLLENEYFVGWHLISSSDNNSDIINNIPMESQSLPLLDFGPISRLNYNNSDVRVIHRPFCLGESVARPATSHGVNAVWGCVVHVSDRYSVMRSCDVEVSVGEESRFVVNRWDLQPIGGYLAPEMLVTRQGWIGCVVDIICTIIIDWPIVPSFSNNNQMNDTGDNSNRLKTMIRATMDCLSALLRPRESVCHLVGNTSYYEGLSVDRLYISDESDDFDIYLLPNEKPLSRTFARQLRKGTLSSISPYKVEVDWKSGPFVDSNTTEPLSLIAHDKVYPLPNLDANYTCGSVFTLSPSVTIPPQLQSYNSNERKDYLQSLIILHPVTTVDVAWQTGEIEVNIPSHDLINIDHVDSHQLWPEDIVRKIRGFDGASEGDILDRQRQRLGIVQSCDTSRRVCTVSWVHWHTYEPLTQFTTEELSIYDVEEVYTVLPGDVVSRVVPDLPPRPSWYPSQGLLTWQLNRVFGSMDSHPLFKNEHLSSRRWYGEVLCRYKGLLGIIWSSGETSWCTRTEVYVIDEETLELEDGNDGSSNSDSSDGADADLRMIVEEQYVSRIPLNSEIPSVSSINLLRQEDRSMECDAVGLPSNAQTSSVSVASLKLSAADLMKEISHPIQHSSTSMDPSDRQCDTSVSISNDCSLFNMGQVIVLSNDDDVASHSFVSFSFSNHSSKFLSCIKNQLSTFMNNGLPDKIWVFLYMNRIDLIRFAIAGPEDTPYHHALFWFDMLLPPDFPNSPPKVKYLSNHHVKLNPNLYEDGHVCLSLLGTWSGPGWDPKTSSLLQILVSIQGLVLVSQPYFNEAGYDRLRGTAEGEHNSIIYNEFVYINVLESVISSIKFPLTPLEISAFILSYYKSALVHIINNCKEMLLLDPMRDIPSDLLNKPLLRGSSGFKISLQRLIEALQALDK